MSAYHDGTNWVEPEDRPLLLPPGVFLVDGGVTQTTIGTGRMGVLNFPDAATNQAWVTVPVPVGWDVAKASILWAKGASGLAGEGVRWQLFHAGDLADGANMNVVDGGGPVTAAAQAQDVLTATVMSAAIPVVAGRLLRMRVGRLGADAADTLTGGAMFAFLRVERVR